MKCDPRVREAGRTTQGKRPATPPSMLAAAHAYVRSGLSVIPIRADGSKKPHFDLLPCVWDEDDGRYKRPWSPFKTRRPEDFELQLWYNAASDQRPVGLAVLGGAVSGGLEIVDCDNWDVALRWRELVRRDAAALFDRLVLVKSPRPGLHAYYRCPEFGGSQKLARVPDPAGSGKPKTIIELKGEPGYCLAPPRRRRRATRPSGRTYSRPPATSRRCRRSRRPSASCFSRALAA